MEPLLRTCGRCSMTWYDISDAFLFVPPVRCSAQCTISTTMWNLMVSISQWPRKRPSHCRWDITGMVTVVNESGSVYLLEQHPEGIAIHCEPWISSLFDDFKTDCCAWNQSVGNGGILGTHDAVGHISDRLLRQVKAEYFSLLNGGCRFRVKLVSPS